MEFSFKCPVCNANNKISKTDSFCRRCKEDLSEIYEIKEKNVKRVVQKIIMSPVINNI